MGLRIDSAERRIELILPRGVSEHIGLRFLAAKRAWVTARLEALPQRVPFVEGAIVPLLGLPHRIRHEPDAVPARHLPPREVEHMAEEPAHRCAHDVQDSKGWGSA